VNIPAVTIRMLYQNHKGILSIRTITPREIAWRSTEHHPEEQFILTAWDHDKSAIRDFALKDCDFMSCRPE